MSDDGFHEIQLNGKQLVFLFMAATVVAVVIFLCGVMVGRGVPPQRAASSPDALEQAALDPTAAARQVPLPSAVAGTGSAPVTAGETLTYAERLADPNPTEETLKPVAETAVLTQPAAPPAPLVARAPAPAPAPEPAPAPKPAPTPAPRATPPVASAPRAPAPPRAVEPAAAVAEALLAEPSGSGFVVQVAAVRKRAEAEAMARRLSAKGYPTFVTTAGANFRVRVGKYNDRRQAEAIAGRLETEEHFKPWITR